MPMDNVEASVVLAPYLEPLVRGRRVVILGDSSADLGPSLVDRGARLVHLYDPDPVRAAESAARLASVRSLVVARLPDGDLAVRDGAFDAVVVPDLSCFTAPDEIIRRASRLLAPTGAAVFAARNLEAAHAPTGGSELTYYELYDAVSLQFPEVRMLGQAPFVGYVVADFAPEEEPDVTVDTSLLEHGAEEPLWFIALASRRPARLDPYAIVQVPMAGVNFGATSQQPAVSTQELEEGRARIVALETDVQAHRAAATKAQDQLKQIESRAGDTHVRAERLESKVRDLEEELRHQRERAFKLSRELDDEKKLKTKIEVELGMMRRSSELPPKPVVIPVDTARIEKLEADLGASMHNAARLDHELADARSQLQRMRKELEQANDDLQDAKAEHAQLRQRIGELQQELDERDVKIAQLDTAAIETAQKQVDRSRDEELKAARRERDEAVQLMGQMRGEQENEVAQLEQKLMDRGRELEALRRDLEHRDQLVRELVSLNQVATVGSEGPPVDQLVETVASLRAQLDRLAALAARRETELQAAQWRVQELENSLARSEAHQEPSAQTHELERALFSAQSELDALRRSLQQEHEAREHAEQGTGATESLAEAHAQVQYDAVLNASAVSDRSSSPGSVDR